MKIFKRNINLGRKVPVIDTPDLRDKCVTTDKLADGSVTTNKIADGAITREKIADRAITNLDNVVQQAQETADHPTLVGEDNYVYAWNKQTHSYDKTSIYVRGEGFHVSKTFDSVADMEAYTGTDLKEGDFVLIQSTPDDPDNAKLYTFSGTQGVYKYLINMSGALGFTGQTPQFSIGSIITIEPTEQASASLSPNGTDSDGNPKYKLNLALPKGEKGTSDFVIVDDHSGAGDDPNKIYIPSANAEKENATAIANEVSRATEAEQTNATAIATEEARARAAELENATAIADEVTRAKAAEQANVTAIGGIEEKIPTQATAQNKLADKDFVNSSISTATADFKGTYNSLADLQAVVGANANDYGFVVTTDAAGNTVYKKYKYVTGTGWAFEYVLNNSSFTAEQWATIQSGMTAALTSKLADLPTNTALQEALTTIRGSVTTEEARARAAEKANATAIANEVTRATEAEQTNATAIATEEARARAAELDNTTAITAEEARARAAEADRYTKSETYTKTEVNDLVDTPHQEYVTVDTYSNLPATGSKDTIYRVSNYNGSTSQVDITSYSEYAWNGSSYIFLCVKSQIGEVFDISVYNNNTKYADLVAALNGGANIPQSLQKGGMSVKFIQSSDNKYVQYRLMSDSFNTTPANWQGVDDEPTAGSENLVKSGGVYSNLKHEIVIDERVNAGSTQQIVRFGSLQSGEKVHIKVSNETGKWITHFYLLYRTTDMTQIQQWSSAFEADIEIEDTAEYALYTNIAAGGNLSYDAYIVINGNSVDELYQGVSENKSNIERLEAKTDYTADTVHVEQTTPTQNVIPINNIYAGTKIRIKCDIVSGVPSGTWMFNFLGEYWTDENEHTFIIDDDGNYNFYTNINEAATVTNFIYNVRIERIGEAATDPAIIDKITAISSDVNTIKEVVDLSPSEQYGDFNSSAQVDNILKFNSFKASRKNANTQQINHIGVLPAGTKVRLVIYNFKVITGSGFFVHFISYNKNDGHGYVNLARLDYSGTIEVTLEEELDIYTISNAGPDTSVDYDLICQYGTALPTVSTKTYIAAWKDDVVSEDSLLKSIHIHTPNSGVFTFGIGTIDWRPIAIISKTFNINLSAGDNIINLTDRKIIMRAGEKLFQYINKNGDDGLCGYTIEESDQHFLFGEETGLLAEYSGKGFAFEAEYQSIDSVFALKEDVNTISDNVESNSETIQEISSSVNIVKDANGNNYELMVVNGVVTPVLMQYSKALIMGNSLSLGMDRWNNPYGMLATRANMDYVSHILTALRQKDANATVNYSISSYELEHNLLNTDFDTMFASIEVWDFDLIVYQGGENVSTNGYSQYQQALENLMAYLKGKCPTAKFVITGVVLDDFPVLENAAKNVANSIGAKYIYCNGHTPDVIIGVSNIWYNKIDNIYEPSDYIKQTHPNDLGFLNLANAILSAIGYRQIEKKHNINISSASVQYSSPKVGVEGGIVTIKTYGNVAPNITVTDANNNTLQITHYRLSDFDYDNRLADGTPDPATYSNTFDMPASDVTVIIQ